VVWRQGVLHALDPAAVTQSVRMARVTASGSAHTGIGGVSGGNGGVKVRRTAGGVPRGAQRDAAREDHLFGTGEPATTLHAARR